MKDLVAVSMRLMRGPAEELLEPLPSSERRAKCAVLPFAPARN